MAHGTNRGKQELGQAIKSHFDRIEDAIRSGNMNNVKTANRMGFQKEKQEVKDYARMKK